MPASMHAPTPGGRERSTTARLATSTVRTLHSLTGSAQLQDQCECDVGWMRPAQLVRARTEPSGLTGGAPANHRLVDPEQFAGIGKNCGVVGQVP
jgi:hypothetical protein